MVVVGLSRIDRPVAGASLGRRHFGRFDRLAFFEFLRRDPWFVFETFVVKENMIRNTIVEATVTEWNRAGSCSS